MNPVPKATPTKPNRPSSPTGSVTSVRSTSSNRSLTSKKGDKEKKPSRFDDPEIPMAVIESYIVQPHRGWDSAIREIARMEANAERARIQRESDTASGVSTVSAYSVASVRSAMSLRSNASQSSVPRKGAGFALGVPQKRTQSQAGRPTTGASQVSQAPSTRSDMPQTFEFSLTGAKLAGSAAGLSGIRATRQSSSAPSGKQNQQSSTSSLTMANLAAQNAQQPVQGAFRPSLPPRKR